MSVLLEFAMFPTDKGESVSDYVSRIILFIDNSGVKYQLTPMGTIIETETFDEALSIIKGAYETLENDCNRIYSSLKFDIRKNQDDRMVKKMQSIEKKIFNK
ncbi:MAG: MTH1187 family thiamine-binding protein [Bacteroidetes bacterium]|nr:MTH1187 family thiamine-binding protein [Bacteroidota bacterium]